MTDAAIKAALRAAEKCICICHGECFETRHGMMHGTCEAEPAKAAAAIAAFHLALGEDGMMHARSIGLKTFKALAAAVERAAGGGDG